MIVETFDKSSPSLIDAADNTCFINLAPAQAAAHLPMGAETGTVVEATPSLDSLNLSMFKLSDIKSTVSIWTCYSRTNQLKPVYKKNNHPDDHD